MWSPSTRHALRLSRSQTRQLHHSVPRPSLLRRRRQPEDDNDDEGSSFVPPDVISPKVHTIPFQLSPRQALKILTSAACSTFGLSTVLVHFLQEFSHKWFGTSPAWLETGVETVAWRACLVPVWKMDARVQVNAWAGDHELVLNVTAQDASLPGFRLSPLDELPISAPFSCPSVPFSPSIHLDQLSHLDPLEPLPSPESDQLDRSSTSSRSESTTTTNPHPITLLPFTHHPLSLVPSLRTLPRTYDHQDGLSINPRQVRTVLSSFSPVWVPVYLGEFSKWDDRDQEEKRVTAVQFATVDSPV
ncbi:hypothetical protein JCM10212_005118 [Sporobolomyces blumeae]